MTRKQLNKIKDSNLYVVIEYRTSYSSGHIEFKGLFFIEKYKKIYRLLKGVQIKYIVIKNEKTGISINYTEDLFNTWLWLIGRKENEL